jgi:DNA-directed RNA polymerase specialized sigma24 family protein
LASRPNKGRFATEEAELMGMPLARAEDFSEEWCVPGSSSRSDPEPASTLAPSRVEGLVSRMRAGDRGAVAEFVREYGPLIRRRVRSKLGTAVRRLFDSEDLLSTVSRRLDRVVAQGQLSSSSVDQFMGLVHRITEHAVIDKVRIVQRIQRSEEEDAQFARAIADRVSLDGADFDFELERVFALAGDEINQQILYYWIHEVPSPEIARLLNIPEGTVRWRWSNVRSAIRKSIA